MTYSVPMTYTSRTPRFVARVAAVAFGAITAASFAAPVQAQNLDAVAGQVPSVDQFRDAILGFSESPIAKKPNSGSVLDSLRNGNLNDGLVAEDSLSPELRSTLDQLSEALPTLPNPFSAPDQNAPSKEEQDRLVKQAEERANAEARAAAERAANTPCPATAKACVDIASQTTWLQENGKISYGPVRMASGRQGQETPLGDFTVQYKVKDEVSREFNNAPMPWAVYFTNSGHAFHQGDPATMSAGCVRLDPAPAEHYFNTLNPGDQVFIY